MKSIQSQYLLCTLEEMKFKGEKSNETYTIHSNGLLFDFGDI